MTVFLPFVVLGLGTGAIYALVASGVVVVFRGSGIVNFAQGTFVMVCAYLFAELRDQGLGVGWAVVASILCGVLLGGLMQLGIMRRLRHASVLTRIIATLGVMISLQAIGSLRYADNLTTVSPFFPTRPFAVGGLHIQTDRVLLLVIAIVLCSVVGIIQRRSLLGLATSASAENESAAAALGWSPGRLALNNWALGGAMAGVAGALIGPVSGLLVGNLTLLIIPALAASLLGGFSSFTLMTVGALGIGIAQSLVGHYIHQPGASAAVPIIVIVVVLSLTGKAVPVRGFVKQRLPKVGSGAIRPVSMLVTFVILLLLNIFVLPPDWNYAVATTLAWSVIALSVVVVTGYAGQISLAQSTMAGIGAWTGGKLMVSAGFGFLPAVIVAILVGVPVGMIFALPSLRTRGVSLAVVTLGLADAINQVFFQNVDYTGGIQGFSVKEPTIFGLKIDALTHPDRYAVFTLVCFVLAVLFVANIRRTASGRRMIAIRENERAAASLGISVTGTKLTAFAVASSLACLGGVLLTFISSSIVLTSFDPFQSVNAIAYAVIGGLGYLLGPVLGSNLASGGTGSLFQKLIPGLDPWLTLIGGVFLVLVLLANHNGLVDAHGAQLRYAGRHARRLLPRRWQARAQGAVPPEPERDSGFVEEADAAAVVDEADRIRVRGRILRIEDLTVRYGGVTAVNGVSLEVGSGEVVGLIGPNGAGKTSLIDAVSGFTRPTSGRVILDGDDLLKLRAHGRALGGVVRSWQALELFEDVSVRENLQAGSDSAGFWARMAQWFWPAKSGLGLQAQAAVHDCQLGPDLDRLPTDIPYGRRRLVGIARAVAMSPSILLLDEPAAGLSDQEARELGALARRLAGEWGMGILLVEHNIELVMDVCDRVVVIDFGTVIATGSPAEVRTNPAVIAAYLGSEDSVHSDDLVARPQAAYQPNVR